MRKYSSFSEKLYCSHHLSFIPQRVSAKAGPEGVHLSILCFIQLVPGRVLEIPISADETTNICYIPFLKFLEKKCESQGDEIGRGLDLGSSIKPRRESTFSFLLVGSSFLTCLLRNSRKFKNTNQSLMGKCSENINHNIWHIVYAYKNNDKYI